MHAPTPSASGHERRRWPWPSLWGWAALVIAALIALPILAVMSRVFIPSDGAWAHLVDTVLPLYVRNSVLLVAMTVTLAVAMGVGAGWLVAMYQFRGRGVFQWALMLPMTVPGYVIAYVYFDRLAYGAPIQTTLREVFGWGRGDYWFPQVASLPGAAFLLAFVLYPYVYLLSRAAFATQAVQMIEAARGLGHSPTGAFFRVALPLARPAIVAGAAFVAMETLADYGTVIHLGVQTMTTGIYRTWFARGEPVAAAQLAALLVGFVALILMSERFLRGTRRYVGDPAGRSTEMVRPRLRGWKQAVAILACGLPIAIGFVLPAVELLRLAVLFGDPMWGPRFYAFAANSLGLAAMAAVLLLVLGLVLGSARRLDGGPLVKGALGVAQIGYAMPGAVIAVGVLLPLGWFDRTLDAWARETLGFSTGLLLTGSVVGLLFAYAVRFLSISLNSVEASLQRIPHSLDEAARGLGSGPARTLATVHFPLLRGGLLTAAIFVFADVMKELPATLIVRPFNLDTLAVRAHRLASDGLLEQAATSALVIVAMGIVPVIILSRAMDRGARR